MTKDELKALGFDELLALQTETSRIAVEAAAITRAAYEASQYARADYEAKDDDRAKTAAFLKEVQAEVARRSW